MKLAFLRSIPSHFPKRRKAGWQVAPCAEEAAIYHRPSIQNAYSHSTFFRCKLLQCVYIWPFGLLCNMWDHSGGEGMGLPTSPRKSPLQIIFW